MPKARTIDRLEYTKNRTIRWNDDGNAAVDAQRGSGDDACPVCGAKVIHEAGCMRCTCGWSACG